MGNMNNPRRVALSEDWVATLIGLGIVAVIALGLIGPGPQKVTLSTAAGETATQDVLALDGWHVSATLGDDPLMLNEAADALQAGTVYAYDCTDGTVSLLADDAAGEIDVTPAEGQAALALVNHCEQDLTITYKTSTAIPWPLFGLFAR